jgi:hypothetical protein
LSNGRIASPALDPLRPIQKILEGSRQRRGINPQRNDRMPLRDRPLDLPSHMRGRHRLPRQDEHQDRRLIDRMNDAIRIHRAGHYIPGSNPAQEPRRLQRRTHLLRDCSVV